jgi:hypothetical protein
MISGDFNMPHISWNNTGETPSTSNSFIEALNDHFLTQINSIPTRDNNILDLIITNVPEHVNITDVESPDNTVIFPDHCVLHYKFNAFVEIPKTKSQRFIYNYKKGNFEGLRSSLSTIDFILCIEQDNINDDWTSWRNTFLGAISKYVPSKKLKGRKQLLWINGMI